MAGPLGALWHLGRAIIATTMANANIATSSSVETSSLDTSALEGDILIRLSVRASGTNSMATAVRDSDDDSTFAAIDSDALVDPDTGAPATFSAVTTSASEQLLMVKKNLCRRYLELSFSGTSIDQDVAVTAVAREKYPA